jgi:chromosomal replication initiation ATPase DnaA
MTLIITEGKYDNHNSIMGSKKLEGADIQKLLKNIVEVLKHYTLPEFNDILVSVVNEKGDSHYAEKYILDLVCETYKISHRALIYSKSNPNVTKARQVTFCLLHFTLGLSTRYIAKQIFHFNHHNTVGSAIKMYKKLNPSLAPDRELKESIELLRDKVITKIAKHTEK